MTIGNELCYLKPNVVIEPLCDRWYAWPHLISPATGAMNIKGRHLKILNSFIQAPAMHMAAVKNPKMRGGPFMNMPSSRVREVEELRNTTLRDHEELLAFADAIQELDNKLKSKARGYSLEPLYEEVPEMLRGYVELIYDLNNQPSFRIYESLLYRSRFYKPSLQSIAMWVTTNDERPFVLSTPRLNEPDTLHLPIPFIHEAIDTLSQMKRKAGCVETLKKMLGISKESDELFNSFFMKEPSVQYDRYNGDNIRMRYFGHACILIETRELSILVDPLVSYYGYTHEVGRYSDMDLPDTIDFVFITHNHQDHILLETLLPLRHKVKNLIVPKTYGGALQDPNLKLMFRSIGFNNVIELSEMEVLQFGNCTITGIPFIGEHSDLNIQAKICYHLQIGKHSTLFMADSCNIENALYGHVQKVMGDVDVIFLGMECDGAPLSWLYGPLLTHPIEREKDESRRLKGSNFDRAKNLVELFHPREVYVYAMGQEPWLEFISSIKYTEESSPIVQSNKLLKYCKENNIVAERLFGEKEILYNK